MFSFQMQKSDGEPTDVAFGVYLSLRGGGHPPALRSQGNLGWRLGISFSSPTGGAGWWRTIGPASVVLQ